MFLGVDQYGYRWFEFEPIFGGIHGYLSYKGRIKATGIDSEGHMFLERRP